MTTSPGNISRAHFHVITSPGGQSSPSMIARHQSGASGRPCRGGFPEPGEKPAQDACSSPRGGALTGGGTGRGNQARHGSIRGQPGRTEEVIQPNWTPVVQGTSCTGHQLYRQWSPTPQTDMQGVMPRSLTPSIFQFPCRFYCSEKEKKRIKLITYG